MFNKVLILARGRQLNTDKRMTLERAVSEFVSDGDWVAMGLALEGSIPFAAGHEMIRQKKRDLTLIGPISDILFDQMIGAGCVAGVIAAWVGNVTTGIGYHFRRAVERGLPRPVEVEDQSNYTVALGLWAGSQGLPFAPCASIMGADISKGSDRFTEMVCPFTGRRLLAVKAIVPDVTVLHVMRADSRGNAHLWGATGISLEALRGARRVILTAEEIVDESVIRSDPDRTKVPGFLADAVCQTPWGAHPSAVQGYYNHDDDYYVEYADSSRDEASGREWYGTWVYGVKDRDEYMARLGADRARKLEVSHSLPTAAADFGY